MIHSLRCAPFSHQLENPAIIRFLKFFIQVSTADLLYCIDTTRFLPGTRKWRSGSEKATDMDNTFGVRRRRSSCSVKWKPSTSYIKTLGVPMLCETKPAVLKITGSFSIRSCTEICKPHLHFWRAHYCNYQITPVSDFYDKRATGVSKSNLCCAIQPPPSPHIFSSFEPHWGLTHALVDVLHKPAARLIKYWGTRHQIFSKSVVLDAVQPSPTPLHPEPFGWPHGRPGMRSTSPPSCFGASLRWQCACCCTCGEYPPLSKSLFFLPAFEQMLFSNSSR